MALDHTQLTRIFCQIDDFCKEFDTLISHYLLADAKQQHRARGPACCLSHSEIMTILVFFQSSGWRHFKGFYNNFLCIYYKEAFPTLPSYHRFIEIMKKVTLHLMLFSQINSGKRTGIYYIDSTCLPTCHIKRSRRHKTFDQVAQYGKTSVGWFFGLKLHLVINNQGELIAFKITRGNESDVSASESLLTTLHGMAFGDKGYISKKLFDKLFEKGLKLVTRARKNMKKKVFTPIEKQLLNKRGIIETVINHFKHHFHIWHTRHRSMVNAMLHLLAGIVAYTIDPLKISAIKSLCGDYCLEKTPN